MTKPKKGDREQEPEARRLRRELFDEEMLDKLMAATDERGLSLTGEGGFLPEMIMSCVSVRVALLGFDQTTLEGSG